MADTIDHAVGAQLLSGTKVTGVGAEVMILIDKWPDEVQAAHEAHKSSAQAAVERRDFDTAVAEFRAAVASLIEAQPIGHRYHKGESLHNLGFVLLFAGMEREAIEATVLAFIEDGLSRAEESPLHRDELDRSAAHNLVYVFGVPGRKLTDVSSWLRLLVVSAPVVSDPANLLANQTVKDLIATASEPTGKRIPGIFSSPQHKRVFVGGYYGQGLLETVLRPIRDEVRRLGYDGILADDFAIPAGQGTDEHAIALLLSCHYAIFDFTERGGQEEEFGRLPDTMKERTLVVYDGRVAGAPKVSGGMTMPKTGRWGITPVAFHDNEQLVEIVRRFLPEPVQAAAVRGDASGRGK